MREQNKLGPHATEYKEWLKALKTRVHHVQLKVDPGKVAGTRLQASDYRQGERRAFL